MSAVTILARLSTVFLLVSHAYAEEPGPQRVLAPEFVQAQMRGVLLPAQRAFAANSADLKQAARDFCAAPQADHFEQLQASYIKTLLAWRTIEVAPIGPSSEDSVGRVMEGPHAPAAQILTLSDKMPAKNMVDGQAADLAKSLPPWGMGFKALESLLYSDKPAQSIKVLGQEKNCAYLAWQAQIVAYKADVLLRSWQGFSNGVGYDMSYPRQFQTEYLNRVIEGARELAGTKVGRGSAAGVWQDQRSGATAQGLKANVAGLRGLLLGNTIGLDDFIISRGMQAEWLKVATQLARLEAAVTLAASSQSEQTALSIANAANGLADVLEDEVAPKLDLKIGKKRS